MKRSLHGIEYFCALAIFTAAFAYIYPDLFFLTMSPMGGDPLTLKDPTVSWSAFMPAFREFRYELLEHGNILWSNLRGMGQPLLGNAIQGAPLFPLNLALLPLPDHLYWSVMPISRVILIAGAAFLIARKIIGLPLLASLLFAILIGFNTNTLRWMNHPWSNGLLAGLWYFYFICRVCIVENKNKRIAASLGLIVSVFAMVTSGFPEASIMSAMIVAFLFMGFVFANWSTLKPSLKQISLSLMLCHLIGFVLSSIQIFALLEFIVESRAMELRSAYGGGAYEPHRLGDYLLAQLSIFGQSKEHQSLLTFSLGLWGSFFAIRGLISLILGIGSDQRKRPIFCFAIAFLLSMVFFIVKAFGLSETLTQIFIATPLLAQSHFPLYFSPLFFIGFAFFAAIGMAELIEKKNGNNSQHLLSTVSSVIAIVTVLILSHLALERFQQMSLDHLRSAFFVDPRLTSLKIFTITGSLIILVGLLRLSSRFRFKVKGPTAASLLASLILILCVIEIGNTVPKGFTPIERSLIGPSVSTQEAINKAFQAAPLARHELRSNDIYGSFVGQGLASVDNGVSAILPPEFRLLRLALFRVPYGGYFPLQKPLTPWSYEALSTNISTLHATPRSNPNWEGYHIENEINTKVSVWPNEVQVLSNPFYFAGRSLAHVQKFHRVSIWLHFEGLSTSETSTSATDNFWIEANIASQKLIDTDNGREVVDTPWRIHVPASWFANDSYQVTVRQIDTSTLGFHDSEVLTLKLDRLHPKAKQGERLQLLASSSNNSQHIFFNTKALPRAYIASACEQADTIDQELDFFRRDNAVMGGKVIFPHNETRSLVPCNSYQGEFQRVAITEDHSRKLSFKAVKGPALLVLNDSSYPGWRAYDKHKNLQSGKWINTELPIERVNSNARSVFLPEARVYNINMVYQPWWLAWVMALVLVAILLTVVLIRTTHHSNK